MLIPIGNDNDTVWRIPWVTFAIIGLNIVIFIFTNPIINRDYKRIEKSADGLYHYLQKHSELIDNDRLDELYLAQVISQDELVYLKHELSNMNLRKVDLERYSSEFAEYQRMLSEFTQLRDNRFDKKYGYVPANPSVISLFTSMFLHGGLLHLLGNMLFFFAIGFSLEDLWGRSFFTVFYLLSGVMATGLHHVWNSSSTIPCIGASGAIAGVMGAYLIRLFKSKIKFIFIGFYIIKRFMIPAYVYLPFWFLFECFSVWSGLSQGSGVANWAHIGGFGFGMVFAFGLKLTKLEERFLKPSIDSKIDFGSSKSVVHALDMVEKGNTKQAEAILNQHMAKNATDYNALMGLARVYEKNGDKDRLRETYGRMIRYHNLAGEYEASVMTYDSLLGTYEEAEPALSLDMRDWMAICDYLAKAEMYKEAAFEYRRAGRTLKTNPFAVKALLISGEIFLEKLKNNKDAAISFVEARDLNPIQPQWIERIAAGIAKIKELELAKGMTISKAADEPGHSSADLHPPATDPPDPRYRVPPEGISL